MVPPVYPRDALRARLRGLVVLRVLVSETGVPLQIQVVQPARGGLTEAAVEAVRQWRFEPALYGRTAVRTWAPVRIPFEAVAFAQPTPTPTPRSEAPTPVLRTPEPPRPASSAAGWAAGLPEPPEPLSDEAASREALVSSTPTRTRRAVRLNLSPQQARITLDGRFIGIADDWDGKGGGLDLEIAGQGPHRLRAELPGYRPLEFEVEVALDAEEDVVDVDAELPREARLPYVRLPKPDAAARSSVLVLPEPVGARITVDGRLVPVAPSARVTSSDISLAGPAVHEIAVSASGYTTRTIRVIAAANAPSSRAVIRVRLAPR